VAGKVGSMKKAIILTAVCLIYLQAANAQTMRKTERVPDKVMEAEFPSLGDGPPVILNTYRNRVTVVVIWAPWCGPCLFALKGIKTLYEEFAPRGVEVIALWPGDEESEDEEGRAVVREYRIEFPVARMGGGMFKTLTSQGNVPQIFLVAGEGVVLEHFVGWHPERTLERVRKAVEKAMTEPPPAQ
jgi:thiol-disulfide isomerase/thioredoxin